MDGCDRKHKGRGYCELHYGRLRLYGRLETLTAADRFWPKVKKTETCWLWMGFLNNWGYGLFFDDVQIHSHRWAYIQAKGPIPTGLQIDHLCRVRHCVKPDHLEAVTLYVNILRGEGRSAQNARKTKCIRGHPLSGENLYVRPDGKRQCRECKRQLRRLAAIRTAAAEIDDSHPRK